MKVESYDNEELGFHIKVAYEDFKKGKDSEEEFIRLCYAVEVFTSATNSDFVFDRQEYDLILKQLKPEGNVIIKFARDEKNVSGRSLVIFVKDGDSLIPVVYKLKNGKYNTCI